MEFVRKGICKWILDLALRHPKSRHSTSSILEINRKSSLLAKIHHEGSWIWCRCAWAIHAHRRVSSTGQVKRSTLDRRVPSSVVSWPNFYGDSPYKSALASFYELRIKFGRVLSITSVLLLLLLLSLCTISFLLSFGSFLFSPSTISKNSSNNPLQQPRVKQRREHRRFFYDFHRMKRKKKKENTEQTGYRY